MFKMLLVSKLDDLKMIIKETLKKIINFIFEGIKEMILMVINTIHYILIVVFGLAVKITNLGFVAAIILFIFNCIEAYSKSVFFTDTRYFNIMTIFIFLHFGVYFIYRLLIHNE